MYLQPSIVILSLMTLSHGIKAKKRNNLGFFSIICQDLETEHGT